MGLLGDIAGTGMDIFNLFQEQKKYDYQKEVQQKTWEREDSAIRRRVEDLKAAGLSPTLAAGSAATTSAPINVSVPKYDAGNLMHAINIESARKQNAVTDAQKDLVQAQIEKTNADSWISRMFQTEMERRASNGDRIGSDLVRSMADKMIADNKAAIRADEEVIRNTDAAREYGVASNSTQAMDAISTSKYLKEIKEKHPELFGMLSDDVMIALSRAFRR